MLSSRRRPPPFPDPYVGLPSLIRATRFKEYVSTRGAVMLRVRSTRSFANQLLTFLAAVLAAAVVRGAAPARYEVASPDIEPDVVGPLQAVAAKALEDTIWIADWSFDAGANCTDAGW